MEQILSFVLGVFIVLVIAGVINMFKTSKTVKQNSKDLANIKKLVSEDILELFEKINKVEDELNRQIDSRVDKLESRIDSKFNDNTSFVDLMSHSIEKLQTEVKEIQVSFSNLVE